MEANYSEAHRTLNLVVGSLLAGGIISVCGLIYGQVYNIRLEEDSKDRLKEQKAFLTEKNDEWTQRRLEEIRVANDKFYENLRRKYQGVERRDFEGLTNSPTRPNPPSRVRVISP